MTDGSVTHWIGQVQEDGEGTAQRELWDHYFARLAALARQQLRDLPPHLRDDEDLALSALNSFYLRAKEDAFPQLRDRTDLWQLLAKITVRKTIDRRRMVQAKKRAHEETDENSGVTDHLKNVVSSEPTPDVLAAINDECQRLLDTLDEALRPVAQMKLEGYTNREIAETLGRVERTVERKLDRIRQVWTKVLEES